MTEPDPKREWWSPHEVADLYRVHISTIYTWIHIGKLPANRFRRNLYRIRREDVMALAEKPEHPEGLKAEEPDEQGHLWVGEGEIRHRGLRQGEPPRLHSCKEGPDES